MANHVIIKNESKILCILIRHCLGGKRNIKAVVGEAHCRSEIRANIHTFASPLTSSYTERAFAGISSDQHGMVCRHIDSDSGLGRSTPPRRAASPGIGSMRHLTSPSGPGSLPPALMTSKKRIYDDGSSDISSTPSSMMDYNGKSYIHTVIH
jgi:hypothetical protein